MGDQKYASNSIMDRDFSFCSLLIRWYKHRRPFLNVYPTVVQCLKNTSIEIDPSLIPRTIINDLGAIEIRTSIESIPPFFMGFVDFYSVLLNRDTKAIVINWFTDRHQMTFNIPFDKELKRVGWSDDWSKSDGMPTQAERKIVKKIGSIAIGVLLLAADTRYCEPILLNRDAGKKLTPEQHAKAVERARNRGVVGFNLGAKIELSPHFRRPHFAIRWTGKGKEIPRLVPVKGAIINRALLGEIPTGYQDDVDSEHSQEGITA